MPKAWSVADFVIGIGILVFVGYMIWHLLTATVAAGA